MHSCTHLKMQQQHMDTIFFQRDRIINIWQHQLAWLRFEFALFLLKKSKLFQRVAYLVTR